MPLMTRAAWDALEAAEAACREGRTSDAWDALSRLSVLDPANLQARFITARLSLAEGAFSRAADLIADYISRAAKDPDISRETIKEARTMAALLAARTGENQTAEREITACLPLCNEGEKLALSGVLAAITSPQRNPRENRRASAVFRYQAERVNPYRRYKDTGTGKPLRVAYLAEDFFAPEVIDLTKLLTRHDKTKVIPSFYRYAPCPQPELQYNRPAPTDISSDIINLSHCTPQEAAGKIHEDSPDILVALTGYRRLGASPLAILAYRPARIQLAGPAALLLRSPELKCLDYLMGDPLLFGEYEPPIIEDTAEDIPAEGNLRREYYETLSRAASAADSRSAGESRNKIHLAYSLSDMNSMTDIIELDDDHAEETADETYSRLSREEHHQLKDRIGKLTSGIADGISDGLENLGSLSKNIGSGFKNRLMDGIDHLKEMTSDEEPPSAPAITVPYIKESENSPEKLLVLPHSLWATEFAPFVPPPSFGRETPEKVSANQSIIADPDLSCLALTDYRTITKETLDIYREILHGHPSVKLAFCHDFADSNDAIRFVKGRLVSAGLPAEQLELVLSDNGPLPLLKPGAFDILLDDGSAPAAFTAHALAAGLPVVTLDGKPPVNTVRNDRQIGRTILRHVWLDEFIATDEESYLNIFDRLAGDHQLRRSLAESLPRTVRESVLGDGAVFLKDLEAAYAFIKERQMDEAAGKVPSIIADHRDRMPETPIEEVPEKKTSFLDGIKGIFSRKN